MLVSPKITKCSTFSEMKWVGSLNFSDLRVAGDSGYLIIVGMKNLNTLYTKYGIATLYI